MSTPIDISERAGVRYLHFGSNWVQGAMRIRQPEALELAYTREMMAGLLLRDGLASDGGTWPRRVLMIGLGAASLAKFVHRHCPQSRIDVVETEPEVVAAARQFFCLPQESARFAIHLDDGARFMLTGTDRYDYVFVDGYDDKARTGALDTLPFHQALRARLSADGLAAFNLLGQMRGHEASVQRIFTAFDGRAAVFPSCDSGNVIAFAAAGTAILRPLAELRARAAILKAETGLDLASAISNLEATGALPGGALVL
ncbi:MAG: fused MFS/spermidine synthase [Azoarcus sp.]|jgi:spermidine synthase|nr:fused MFS/spermidine synthase [Azoarcus sp.]